jgi:hypothetical protein
MKKIYTLSIAFIVAFSANSQMAITEFIVNPNNSDTDREWIELYNYSRSPVNLRDWKIRNSTGSNEIIISTNDFFVPSGGYVILAKNKTTFESEWLGGTPNVNVISYNSASFTLINTSETFNLGYSAGVWFTSVWKVNYSNDDVSGQTTFYPEYSTLSQRGYTWGVNRSGNDTIDSGTGTTNATGYENSGHTSATTSTNGDVGTPFAGGYSQEAMLLNEGTCTTPHQLTCGTTFSGNTSNGENNIYNYDCATQNEYGAEEFHAFTLTQAQDVVITLSGMTGDLDVHLLNQNACDGTGCIARNDNTITQTNLAAGTYFIAVDGFGTSYNTLSAYNLLVTCNPASGGGNASIYENNIASSIKVYPNPSTGIINIKSEEHTITNINVRDMSGRIIIANQDNSFTNINLGNVTNGFYFIDIETNNGRTIKKVSVLK